MTPKTMAQAKTMVKMTMMRTVIMERVGKAADLSMIMMGVSTNAATA